MPHFLCAALVSPVREEEEAVWIQGFTNSPVHLSWIKIAHMFGKRDRFLMPAYTYFRFNVHPTHCSRYDSLALMKERGGGGVGGWRWCPRILLHGCTLTQKTTMRPNGGFSSTVGGEAWNPEVVYCFDCRMTCIQWPRPFSAYMLISSADRFVFYSKASSTVCWLNKMYFHRISEHKTATYRQCGIWYSKLNNATLLIPYAYPGSGRNCCRFSRAFPATHSHILRHSQARLAM